MTYLDLEDSDWVIQHEHFNRHQFPHFRRHGRIGGGIFTVWIHDGGLPAIATVSGTPASVSALTRSGVRPTHGVPVRHLDGVRIGIQSFYLWNCHFLALFTTANELEKIGKHAEVRYFFFLLILQIKKNISSDSWCAIHLSAGTLNKRELFAVLRKIIDFPNDFPIN